MLTANHSAYRRRAGGGSPKDLQDERKPGAFLVPGDGHQRCAHGPDWAEMLSWNEDLLVCF